MKSAIFALLPLAGLAFAESSCPARETVTKTEYARVTKTFTVAEVDAKTKTSSSLTPKRSSCSRKTIYTTTYEKVTVTVTPDTVATPDAAASASASEIEKTIDVTITSTRDITTTIIVRPSTLPPYSNSTFSARLSSIASVEPSAVPYPTLSVLPTTLVDYSVVYTGVPQSEAPVPSSTYAAPAQSPVASAAAKAVKDTTTSAAGSKKGEATFYGGNVSGGMCSFTGYTIPSNLYGTALSDSNWDGANACGTCVSVTGPDGYKITAMVVDQCPGCGTNHLDLFPDAFAKLAEPSKGKIPVSWDVVPCGITTPIVLKNKEGTSKYWFSMQVMNANVGVSKLEVSTDGGATWKATTRKEYNFFENPAGFGTDSVDVKVTSVSGTSIIVKGVSIAAQSTKTAASNFA